MFLEFYQWLKSFRFCYGLNIFPSNSYDETLTPNMMIISHGMLGSK